MGGDLSSIAFNGEVFSVASGGGGSGVIEGEYIIPEVYWCTSTGAKEANNAIAGQNVKVWYQKTGKFVRAAMAFVNNEFPSSSTYRQSFGFNRADLFGDGKLFLENAELVFFKFSAYGQALPIQSGTSITRDPYFLLVAPTSSGTGYVDLYIDGTTSVSTFPNQYSGGMNHIVIEAACL